MKDTDWEILSELHRSLSITKTAKRLYMSQPSVTKRLRSIEEEFGVAVVERGPQGVSFTPEGSVLAEQARKYLSFMQETKGRLKELAAEKKEIINVGSSYTFAKYSLMDLLLPFSQKHPRVDFQVDTSQSNVLYEKLCEGRLDVAFVRGDFDGAPNKTLIGKNRAYAVSRQHISLADLPSMQRIDFHIGGKSKYLLDAWWKDYFGFEAPAGMGVGHIDVAWQMISKGAGYTLCFLPPQFTNDYDLALEPLSWRNDEPLLRNTWLMYPDKKAAGSALDEFIQYVQETVALS